MARVGVGARASGPFTGQPGRPVRIHSGAGARGADEWPGRGRGHGENVPLPASFLANLEPEVVGALTRDLSTEAFATRMRAYSGAVRVDQAEVARRLSNATSATRVALIELCEDPDVLDALVMKYRGREVRSALCARARFMHATTRTALLTWVLGEEVGRYPSPALCDLLAGYPGGELVDRIVDMAEGRFPGFSLTSVPGGSLVEELARSIRNAVLDPADLRRLISRIPGTVPSLAPLLVALANATDDRYALLSVLADLDDAVRDGVLADLGRYPMAVALTARGVRLILESRVLDDWVLYLRPSDEGRAVLATYPVEAGITLLARTRVGASGEPDSVLATELYARADNAQRLAILDLLGAWRRWPGSTFTRAETLGDLLALSEDPDPDTRRGATDLLWLRWLDRDTSLDQLERAVAALERNGLPPGDADTDVLRTLFDVAAALPEEGGPRVEALVRRLESLGDAATPERVATLLHGSVPTGALVEPWSRRVVLRGWEWRQLSTDRAQWLARRMTARLGDDLAAWARAAALFSEWGSTLDDLLETVVTLGVEVTASAR